MWLIILMNIKIPEYAIYDCRLAEIHPDFPPAVKEECRRKILEEWRRSRENQVQTGIHDNSKSLCQSKSCQTT